MATQAPHEQGISGIFIVMGPLNIYKYSYTTAQFSICCMHLCTVWPAVPSVFGHEKA